MGGDRAGWFVAALGLAVGAVLFWGARSIAPPIFDPVGSAALPEVAGAVLIGLGLATLGASLRQPAPAAERAVRPATLGTLALMAAYLGAMQAGLGFTLSTAAFVAAAIPLVSGGRRAVPAGLALALVLAFGAEWVFTAVFFVDLPGSR